MQAARSGHGPGARGAQGARAAQRGHEPDPRLLQVCFGLLVLLEVALRLPGALDPGWRSWPGLALVLLVVTTLATVLLPRARDPLRYVPLVLLDLAVVGMVRLTPEGSAAAILSVLPALWLARHAGRRGVLGAGLGVLVLVSAPGIACTGVGEVQGVDLAGAVLLPLVAVAAGLVIAAGAQRAEVERDEARRRGRELAAALDTIDHQRRTGVAILDTVDVGLLLIDAEGRYVGQNKRHEDFMRLAFPEGHAGAAGQLGQVRQADATTLVSREEMPTHRAARGEEFDDIRMWIGTGSEQRAVSVSARSIRDQEGRHTGSALAYKDVTDFMDALAIKDEFVAAVSHELRTPLTSIVGYLSVLLERDDLPEQAVRHLQVADRNAQRLDRLVGDLLTTAVTDASPTSLQRSACDVVVLVREQTEAAQPVADERGVTLEARVPTEAGAEVDGQRLRQVVDNLVHNALKHTPRGGRVVVSLESGADELAIEVADSGPGIDPAERERVFDRFFRTRASREQVVPGVGLGLAITRDIVAAHGGSIELEEAPGGGLLARVLLPRGDGAVGSGA